MTVSASLRELLATRVDTFEKLDMVVALAGSPHHSLDIDTLAERLGCSRPIVRQTVGELRKAMLVDLTSRGAAQLMSLNEIDRRTLDELVAVYRADRAVIVHILGELAMRRIRGMAARAFADAFVLGKRKKEDSDG